MAYLGMRKPIVAPWIGNKTYGDPFAFGKAIGIQVNPSYAEGSLNADDEQAEYDKEFNYAEVTLNTSTIPIKAYNIMFGHTVDEEKKKVKFNKDDQAAYVGTGWIASEVVNGKKHFTGNILYKAKYSEPADDHSTKGDSIEYKTPSISGRAVTDEDGDWKETEQFETVTEALNWIYEMFGKAMKKLVVSSAESEATVGKTKITVTEAVGEENKRLYKTGKNATIPAYNDVCDTSRGWTEWNGTDEIAAKTGDKIVIVDVTSEGNFARAAGEATVTAKEE